MVRLRPPPSKTPERSTADGAYDTLLFSSLCCRAVQAGKGPAPRHKGAPVGELRDAAVRHLRGVLVTYAILTIQNPEMWGDEVSSWLFFVVDAVVVVVVDCCC